MQSVYSIAPVDWASATEEDASSGIKFNKLDLQTYASEFVSHLVLFSYGLVLPLNKTLSKLPQ